MTAVSLVRPVHIVIPDRDADRILCLRFVCVLFLKIYFFSLQCSDHALGSRVASWSADATQPKFQALDLDVVLRVI